MSLTPDQVKRLRRRDAAAVRTQLDAAERAVNGLRFGVGAWADSMRASVELRHKPDTADEVLWAAPDYSRALNAFSAIERAITELASVKQEFLLAEGAARRHEAPAGEVP